MLSQSLHRPVRPKVGGLGASTLGHTLHSATGHTLNSMLGDARKANTAQKIALGVAAVFTGGLRIGLSCANENTTTSLTAAAFDGFFFPTLERLVVSVLGNTAPATRDDGVIDAKMVD